MENKTVITAQNVAYDYVTSAETVHALRDFSCDFAYGKMYAITGRSGSGKSTLLSLLAGFDLPKKGSIHVLGEDMQNTDREEYRRKHVGIIFQSYYLVPHLTVFENIRLSMEITQYPCSDYRETISALLQKVGLPASYITKSVTRLSGGEQQRVAIARAIASDPAIILADEPTGNLDDENAGKIYAILRDLATEGKCVIIVTHSQELAAQCDVVVKITDGTCIPGCFG